MSLLSELFLTPEAMAKLAQEKKPVETKIEWVDAKHAPAPVQKVLKKAVKLLPCDQMVLAQRGDVKWRVFGNKHCGLKQHVSGGRIAVRYRIELTCAPKLDDKGFLFDQSDLRSFMKSRAEIPTELSCEALAWHTAELLMEEVAAKVPTCELRGLTIKLSPYPYMGEVRAAFGVPAAPESGS